VQRDPIYAALLGQLQQLLSSPYSALNTASRGFVMWDESGPQPACYIVPVTEHGAYKRGFPTKWTFNIELYVYVKWQNTVDEGVVLLAQTMDAIDLILSPTGPNGGVRSDNGFVNNLGGLAVYCALNGAAEISGGFLNKQQTIARMPVEIVVA
jgi:hypothetical protein